MDADQIEILGLKVFTHIGVPDDERAHAQELLVDLWLVPSLSFAETPDALGPAVDYAAVASAIVALAAARPRQLIETLASEIAALVLGEFAVRRVEVRVRKFILPETEHVAVRLVREKTA